jgi:hypothetical protein
MILDSFIAVSLPDAKKHPSIREPFLEIGVFFFGMLLIIWDAICDIRNRGNAGEWGGV